MRNAITLLALAAFASAAAPALAADGPADLVGMYKIESGEKFGNPEPKDKIQGDTVRFSEDRVVVVDKNSKEVFGASYKLDTSSKPWKITMTSKLSPSEGTVAKGLLWKEGDTLKLIYALPGGDEPTDFKTKDKQLMFVMKYEKK